MAADNDYHDGLCQKCGVYQNLKAFRRTHGCRIRVCRRCELMQCIACTAQFSQICFTATEISNYFTKATPVVCLQCKRRGCTPRTPHPRFHGCYGPCARVLGRAAYTRKDWSMKKNNKTYKIVCKNCLKDEAARVHSRLQQLQQLNEATRVQTRLQQLRQLMLTSKRRRCVCHAIKPHLHAKRCPMHMTFAGEIPYPGCDVMTSEDSAWLRKRDERYRLRRHGGRHLHLDPAEK